MIKATIGLKNSSIWTLPFGVAIDQNGKIVLAYHASDVARRPNRWDHHVYRRYQLDVAGADLSAERRSG